MTIHTPLFSWDTRIPMRDGITLSTDIYFPESAGPHPLILQRTPYDNSNPPHGVMAKSFTQQGYIFAIQDVRGRCDSDGEWDPWMTEDTDGYDTIEWLAAQPWCNGKVGMMGGSYLGFVQWRAARECPPHLVTLAATVSLGRWGHEFPCMNGKMNLETLRWLNLVAGRTQQMVSYDVENPVVDWNQVVLTRPMIDMDITLGRTNTVWRTWMEHITLDDDYWKKITMQPEDFRRIDLPVLHITGWFDDDQVGALSYYNGMMAYSPAKQNQYLMIGPWDHSGTRRPQTRLGDMSFPENSQHDFIAIHLRWFDHWLKGIDNGVEKDPAVRLYTMGKNEWQEYPSWPVPGVQEKALYLHSDGSANSRQGDGALSLLMPENEPEDHYIYDPEDPTPGMRNFPQEYYLPVEQEFAEKRSDVLVFSTPVLEEALEVTGVSFVELYAASDAVDTDFAAVLCDVSPDGASIRLAENIMRASYRDSLEHPTPIEPGKVYRYRIELNGFSHVFLPGHRIRLDVMSARFPTWSRNPNTGAPEGYDLEMRPARQTLYHRGGYASRVLLPVVNG